MDSGKKTVDNAFVTQEVLAEVFGGFDFAHRMSM